MNRIMLFLCAVIIALNVNAKEFKVNVSKYEKVSSGSIIRFAGGVDDYVHIVSRNDGKGKEYSLKVYDANTLQIINEVELIGKGAPFAKGFIYTKTLFADNKVIVMFETFEKKSKTHRLYAQSFTLKGEKIGKAKLINSEPSISSKRTNKYKVWPSQDSTKFIVIKTPDNKKKADLDYLLRVYDGELKNISSAQVQLPYKNEDVRVLDYYVCNGGEVLLLVQVDKEDKEKRTDTKFFEALLVEPDGGAMSKYKIELPGKKIEDVGIRLNETDGVAVCAGFYADIHTSAKRTKGINGVYYMLIDLETKAITKAESKSLPNDIIAQLNSDKKLSNSEKKRGVSNSFSLRDIHKLENGNYYIVAEQRRDYIVTHTSQNGGTTTTHHYERGNLFTTVVSNEGEILQFTDIPKKQHTVNDGGFALSFGTLKTGNDLVYLYNEHKRNLTKDIRNAKDLSTLKKLKGAILVGSELKSDGTYTKTPILNNKDNKLTVMPEFMRSLGEDSGQVVVPFQKTKPRGYLGLFYSTKMGVMKISLN